MFILQKKKSVITRGETGMMKIYQIRPKTLNLSENIPVDNHPDFLPGPLAPGGTPAGQRCARSEIKEMREMNLMVIRAQCDQCIRNDELTNACAKISVLLLANWNGIKFAAKKGNQFEEATLVVGVVVIGGVKDETSSLRRVQSIVVYFPSKLN